METPPPFTILDIGSHTLKVNQSTCPAPILVRTLAGRPKYRKVILESAEDFNRHKTPKDNSAMLLGDEAYRLRGAVKLTRPVKNGVVTSWDKFESLCSHIYYDTLKVEPGEQGTILTDLPLSPLSQREKLATFFFETLRVPSLFVCSTAYAAALSEGFLTALSVDLGEGAATCVPIYNGEQRKSFSGRSNIAGGVVSEFLGRLLQDKGLWLLTSAEHECAREMKERACFVAEDYNAAFEKQVQGFYDQSYTLPDGKVVVLGRERFLAPEVLFRPEVFELEAKGLHKLVNEAGGQCRFEEREQMFSNVFVSGGSARLAGLESRLQTDLGAICSSAERKTIKVRTAKDPTCAAWLGAALLSKLGAIQTAAVTAKEFEEQGANVIKAKFSN